MCREGLETLSVVLALYPPALETLTKDNQFHKLVMGLVLVGGERSIRQCAVEQLLLMATKCSNSPHTLVVFIVMLFNVLNGLNGEYSKEYFQVCIVSLHFLLVIIAQLRVARHCRYDTSIAFMLLFDAVSHCNNFRYHSTA